MKGSMSIKSVKLYKLHGVQWVFDDPAKNIYQEAFVDGADDLLDDIVGEYDPNNHYTLQFSTEDFPNSLYLEFLPRDGVVPMYREELIDSGSYWVYTKNYNDGREYEEKCIWLCDTLDEYATDDDKLLYFNVKCFKPQAQS